MIFVRRTEEETTLRSENALPVRMLLFSVLREHVGAGHLEMNLRPDAAAADLLDAFFLQFPQVQALRPTVRIAINSEYASPETRLRPGDEVALITPVSGG